MMNRNTGYPFYQVLCLYTYLCTMHASSEPNLSHILYEEDLTQ